MRLKGRAGVHTYRWSIPEPTHTLPQLNGSSLIKPAIPPPALATVLTFEKIKTYHIPTAAGQRRFDFNTQTPPAQ